MDLAEEIYAVTREFPRTEIYGLAAQLRKAAVSIPSNIAEGSGRRSDADFRRFLNIAHGSLLELETQMELATRLGFVAPDLSVKLIRETSQLGKMITALVYSLRSIPY